MALMMLAIPCTSSAAERAVSSVNYIVRDRSRLTPEHIGQLSFIRDYINREQ